MASRMSVVVKSHIGFYEIMEFHVALIHQAITMTISLYNSVGTTSHGSIETADDLVHVGHWIRIPASGKMTDDTLYVVLAVEHTVAVEGKVTSSRAVAWETSPDEQSNSMRRLMDGFEER